MEEKNSRRNFLKETALAGASLLVAPSLLRAAGVNSLANGADNVSARGNGASNGGLNGIGSGNSEGNEGSQNNDGAQGNEAGAVRGGNLIVPKDQGLKITGTFLDEISHDIPHQNWGVKEWD